MSRTLTFHDAGWASARATAQSGRRADALARLKPLISSPDCPPRLARSAHRLAARLYLQDEKWGKARRHLRAALDLHPQDAAAHYEMGLAYENDPYGCDVRAARCFRRAVRCATRQAKYVAALGRALVRLNRVAAGVNRLRAAAALAPADAGVLRVIVDALADAGKPRLAYSLTTKAKFLAPANPEVQQLWQTARFAVARQARPKAAVVGAGPAVLPLVRLVGGGGVVRRDAGSKPRPHVGWLKPHRAERG
jgi:Flp pilus assembly protein TadD